MFPPVISSLNMPNHLSACRKVSFLMFQASRNSSHLDMDKFVKPWRSRSKIVSNTGTALWTPKVSGLIVVMYAEI